MSSNITVAIICFCILFSIALIMPTVADLVGINSVDYTTQYGEKIGDGDFNSPLSINIWTSILITMYWVFPFVPWYINAFIWLVKIVLAVAIVDMAIP